MINSELYDYFDSLLGCKDSLNNRSLAELYDLRKNLTDLVYNESNGYIFKRAFYKCCLFMLGTQAGCLFVNDSNMKTQLWWTCNLFYGFWNAYSIYSLNKDELRKLLVKNSKEMLIFINELIKVKIKNWSEEEMQKSKEYRDNKKFFEQFGIKIRLLEKRIKFLVNNKEEYQNMLASALNNYNKMIARENKIGANKFLSTELKRIRDLLDKEIYYGQEDLYILFINRLEEFKNRILVDSNIIECFKEYQGEMLAFNWINEEDKGWRNHLIVKAFEITVDLSDIVNRSILVELLDENLVSRAINLWEEKMDFDLEFDFRTYIKKDNYFDNKEYLIALIDMYYIFKEASYARRLDKI